MLAGKSLRLRILTPVFALAALTICGALLSFWYTSQVDEYFHKAMEEGFGGLQAADRLESTLIMQKGYLTYFFQDGRESWLVELEKHKQRFDEELSRAEKRTRIPEEMHLLRQIREDFVRLTESRQEVIDLYRTGQKEKGYLLHLEARREFFQILELAGAYRQKHEGKIAEIRKVMTRRSLGLRRLALTAGTLTVVLGAFLVFVLVRQVLDPLRRLVREAAPAETPDRRTGNEVQALSNGLHTLMEDFSHARSELEDSRFRLLQSAKMASVGKIAASVAHSIRNPLTAVKMRLFSLERSLELDEAQREDLTVIGEEIKHIDSVLRNFLEFSRRPRLIVQAISPSKVVDHTLELMGPRLDSAGVSLDLVRQGTLPQIQADPDQLREALVNLLVNASEAVGRGGRVTVLEDLLDAAGGGRWVVIRVRDNGPGIPPAFKDQVFTLFFSTKDEGTGLGLSIASQIVEEHGGDLSLTTPAGGGAEFIIRLPLGED